MVILLTNIQIIFSSTLLTKTNDLRRHKQLKALKSSPELNRIAQKQANFMCLIDTLTHLNEKNEELGDRLNNYDLKGNNIGENIARQQIEDIDSVFQVWFSSETHKQNLLGNYSHSGIGTCKSKTNLTYWVQIFYGDNQKYKDPFEYSSSSLIYNSRDSGFDRLPQITIKTLNGDTVESTKTDGSNKTNKKLPKQRVEINEPVSQIGVKGNNPFSNTLRKDNPSDRMHIDIKSPYNKKEFIGLVKNLVKQTVDSVIKRKPDSSQDSTNTLNDTFIPKTSPNDHSFVPSNNPKDNNTTLLLNHLIDSNPNFEVDDPLIPSFTDKQNTPTKKVADMSIGDLQAVMKSVLKETHSFQNPNPSMSDQNTPVDSNVSQLPIKPEPQLPSSNMEIPTDSSRNEPKLKSPPRNEEDTHLRLNEFLASLVPPNEQSKSSVPSKNQRDDTSDQLLLKNLLLDNIKNKMKPLEDNTPKESKIPQGIKDGNTKRLVDFFENLGKEQAPKSDTEYEVSKDTDNYDQSEARGIKKGNTKGLVDFFKNLGKSQPRKNKPSFISSKETDINTEPTIQENDDGKTKRLVDFFEILEKEKQRKNKSSDDSPKDSNRNQNNDREMKMGNMKKLVDFFENKTSPKRTKKDTNKKAAINGLKYQFNEWLQNLKSKNDPPNSTKNKEKQILKPPEKEHFRSQDFTPIIGNLLKDFLEESYSRKSNSSKENDESSSG